MSGDDLRLVATCALGLEELVAAELAQLGARDVEPERGAVAFRGGWDEVYRANWRLRTANRVLVELARFPAGAAGTDDSGAAGDLLYAAARDLATGRGAPAPGIDAAALLHPDRSFAIQATATASAIRDSRWAALRVKDGLVDGQRERFGRRASVERDAPDLPLRLRLHRDRATLSLDTSGEPLDRRGYRLETAEAPVREHLAAACVLASGWDGAGPVVDPMCGSGTLLIEAALWALGRAPGAARAAWAFERLPGYDRRRFDAVRAEPIPAPNPDVALLGNDRSIDALVAAQGNLERAGLAGRTTLSQADAFAFAPPAPPGLVLINPPHGHRLAEAADLWPRLGDLLKQRYRGYRAAILAGEGFGKGIGLKPKRRIPVWNGPLEGRILVFDLY
ncbi:MAG TPA: RNA methyltransferase [Thermoanaerobaculia bacterium]|nr:RNA methyltransferase [Thermoanaerobaculia bacterium]